MFEVMSRYWWVLLIRGVSAMLFGILAWTWPGMTLAVLVMFFGAYALVDGVFLLIHAFGGHREKEDRWLVLLEGLVSLGIGIITFVAPGITAIALLLYIAVWSISTGVLEISAAVRLRKEMEGEGWMIIGGIASIVFGVLLMIFPAAGAMGLLALIAAYAVIFGISLVVLSFRLRSHRRHRSFATP
jgi:uncharacterized membrane protein HdeD (DUF308 family)